MKAHYFLWPKENRTLVSGFSQNTKWTSWSFSGVRGQNTLAAKDIIITIKQETVTHFLKSARLWGSARWLSKNMKGSYFHLHGGTMEEGFSLSMRLSKSSKSGRITKRNNLFCIGRPWHESWIEDYKLLIITFRAFFLPVPDSLLLPVRKLNIFTKNL